MAATTASRPTSPTESSSPTRPPWQCGSNENAHGLLRQYLAKRTDLNPHDLETLARIE